jgi:UDP-N-acetylmuramoyl-tripeptide--D-alanyl-D-alanine ligase
MKEPLENSNADYILGYGEHFKAIFQEEQMLHDNFQWFATLQELTDRLEELLNEDSLILAKGSVTGSDFHEIDRYIRKMANKKSLTVG